MHADGKEWPAKPDAAAQLGISEAEIDRLVSEKHLNARKRSFAGGEVIFIDPESIRNLQQNFGAAGALVRVEEPLRLSTHAARTGGMELAFLTFLQSLVASASSSQTVPVERRIFLTVAESAELSGLPAGFLRRLMRDGTLKAIRAGTRWRIPRAELESLANKLTNVRASHPCQELSQAEERDLEMNRLRRQGLLPPDRAHEIN